MVISSSQFVLQFQRTRGFQDVDDLLKLIGKVTAAYIKIREWGKVVSELVF